MADNNLKDPFPIKGFKEGLLVTLGDGNWDNEQKRLLLQIDEKSNFFKGAKIAIEIGDRVLHAGEIARLRDLLFDREVRLFALMSNSPVTDVNAESLGLRTRKSVLRNDESGIQTAAIGGEPAILLQRTLRSGTSIKYTGHVVVIGDMNPGAEIISSGSVFVWGKVRGNIIAGVDGNEDAVICAMDISTTKLRIANIESTDNITIQKLRNKPAKVKINQNELVYEFWDGKKRK